LHSIVVSLLIANTLNIGADLGAMAEASQLLAPRVPFSLLIGGYALVCVLGQVLFKHTRYVSVLKWLTLSLFTYFAALCVLHVDWRQLAASLAMPQFEPTREFWSMVVAILGTTISPYLFFWQASQEVEDTKAKPERDPLRVAPFQGPTALARIRADTLIGMGFSNLVALAILVTAATTLHAGANAEIASAAQAAEALRPVAGDFAFALFSIGILGTGLLSVPVLAGSAAYALGEARAWPVGLARRPLQAKAFYATIAVATLIGALGNALSISAVKALIWAAVINGLIAVPVMVILMLIAQSRRIMGQFRIGPWWIALGWAAIAAMSGAAVALLALTLT
jgi:Mn2+/Fe2+ NRAMP family transporter